MSTKIIHLLSGQQGIYFLGARGGLLDGEFGVASPAFPNRQAIPPAGSLFCSLPLF